MKTYSQFVCQQCGYETASWLGKCPECGQWGSLVEVRIGKQKERGTKSLKTTGGKPQRLSEIKTEELGRISTQIFELDRVLGGGLVSGSVVLLAGDPGIGKSTLLLQVAMNLATAAAGSILYISGEESPEQIKIRALRLRDAPSGASLRSGQAANLLLLAETNLENILAAIEKEKPRLLIIDSIQTIWSGELLGTAGSVGQVRECAAQILSLVKSFKIPCFLVGHVTKVGAIAGPMVLAHLVDAVLYFEGERSSSLRLLRSIKNRFGPTDEVGVFQMAEKGMVEVENPSQFFLGKTRVPSPGAAIICTLQGLRPILAEVQALVVATSSPIPRRVFSGLDFNRCQLLLAILQKRLNLPLGSFDVYLNVAGGLKISEPAADLGICLAIYSSFKNKPLASFLVAMAEVGLLGELRVVEGLEKRIQEARRFKFSPLISAQDFSTLEGVVKKVFP